MGAKFDEEKEIPENIEPEKTPTVFGDSKSFEHLSMEERKAMTERMKINLLGFRRMTDYLGNPALRKQRSKDG